MLDFHPRFRCFYIAVAALLAAFSLGACSSTSSSGSATSRINPVNWITPYRVDVIQGNFVSSEQISQLRAGMPREQVKNVLGTPLLASVFHADRWDYVFTLQRQGVQPQSYKYTVFFKGDALERFAGDEMPSEAEFISRLDSGRSLGKAPSLQATEAQLKTAAPTRPQSARAADPPVSAASPAYPPLESVLP